MSTLVTAWVLARVACQNLGVTEEEATSFWPTLDGAVRGAIRTAPDRDLGPGDLLLRKGTPERWPIRAEGWILCLQAPSGPGGEGRWIAAINVRGGLNGSNAFLRLYAGAPGRVRLEGSTDDTPLLRAARTGKGLGGRGELGWCLQHRVNRVTVMGGGARAKGGVRIRAEYEHLWGG